MEGKSTRDNINDLLKFGRDIQKKRKEDKTTAALVFFDLKNAYNTVPRDLLIKKIEQFNIPCNITAVVNDMLGKFRLKYENVIIETKRGLVQGSTISPILFNIFLNDLLNLFKDGRIQVLAYADDVVWLWENSEANKSSHWNNE